MNRPPTRLVNDPAVAAALRGNLQRVREADAGYDAARGLARLQASLELPVPAPGGAQAGLLKLATSKVAWLGALGAAVGVVGVVATVATVATVPVRESPAPPRSAAPHAQPALPPSAATSPLAPATPPEPPDDGVRREIEQLAQIRALLPVQPAAAHALAQRAAREFPRGALREEREALDALALARLGKRAEARQAARAFLERHPHSPLRQAIEPLLREAP